MNETEAHVGKLVPIDLEGLTVVEYLVKNDIVDFSKPDPFGVYMNEYDIEDWWHSSDYLEHQEKLYKVFDSQCDPDYFTEHQVNDDGEIKYQTTFYNGGACIKEVLEDILDEYVAAKERQRLLKDKENNA